MNKEQIENIISDIMINDGADGHCDGANIIADFVEALLNGKDKEWVTEYFNTKDKWYYDEEKI